MIKDAAAVKTFGCLVSATRSTNRKFQIQGAVRENGWEPTPVAGLEVFPPDSSLHLLHSLFSRETLQENNDPNGSFFCSS